MKLQIKLQIVVIIYLVSLCGAESEYFRDEIKEFPCPNATDIAPCICTESTDGLVLNCDNVTSDQQFADVFQANFPVTEFFKLNIISAPITILNITKLTFQVVDIKFCPIEWVSQYFLRENTNTLESLTIRDALLTQDTFAISEIEHMTKLRYLNLYYNIFTFIPPLKSPSMEEFRIGYNNLSSISPGEYVVIICWKSNLK